MPIIDGFDGKSIQTVSHFGIVAGAYESLGRGKVIDRAIPKIRHYNLTHSQTVEMMVLNGLGFIERRLYLFPDFFDDIVSSRLVGDGITRDNLNDEVFGRTLDAIAEYGPTELFNQIVAECLLPSEFGSHCIHVDTTNIRVTRDYEPDFGCDEIQLPMDIPKTEDVISNELYWELRQTNTGFLSFCKHSPGTSPTKGHSGQSSAT